MKPIVSKPCSLLHFRLNKDVLDLAAVSQEEIMIVAAGPHIDEYDFINSFKLGKIITSDLQAENAPLRPHFSAI